MTYVGMLVVAMTVEVEAVRWFAPKKKEFYVDSRSGKEI
jgi:hypothetical protein